VGSDLARVTFDPTRKYRSVVAQQGRVTLEADVNEASMIASEALRLETIDLVGPAATPDDGYAVGIDSDGDLSVGAGTFYLGGWRLTLDAPVKLAQQPDWLDQPGATLGGEISVVALLASEQSICAVEDVELREPALGGPDTAARTRLMQHFLMLPSRGRTCESAAATVSALLQADGVTLDPATDQLISSARLQVGFTPPTTPPDPCQPNATGGYLGPDNQLVRVTVVSFDPQKRGGVLAWGWNNASFLYRAMAVGPNTLRLSPTPIDAEHSPRQGQAIEILQAQADLGDGDLIADPSGPMVVLDQAYDPDTNTITLPAGFTLPASRRPLFIRLWEATVPFTVATPVALDTTSGLTVAIDMTALPSHVAGLPFWRFAVRPNTPVLVYPRRYLEAPQPPDGPRQWLCDLAVVAGADGRFEVLDDCRHTFPIGDGGTCCAKTIAPQEAAGGGLQAALDELAGSGPASLTLLPGVYELDTALTLTAEHAWLTLEGCSGGAVLKAAAGAALPRGLMLMEGAPGVTLRGLVFELSTAPPGGPMLGVLADACPQLTIEDCRFLFDPAEGAAVSGTGLLLTGDGSGLALRRNSFVYAPAPVIVLAPAPKAKPAAAVAPAAQLFGVVATGSEAAQFDDVEISGNLFASLAVAASFSTTLGLVRCRDNRVRGCAGGFWFVSAGKALNTVAGAFDLSTNLTGLVPQAIVSTADLIQKAVTAAAAPAETATKAKSAAKSRAKAAAAPAVAELLAALEKDLEAAADNPLTLVAHLHDNDIELAVGAEADAAYPGLRLTAVVGQVVVGGNRVSVASARAPAVVMALRDGQAAVSGNLFVRTSAESPIPCVSIQVASGPMTVMGNVIHGVASILPDRPAIATTGWAFMNTIG
jgi:hypothetical protein